MGRRDSQEVLVKTRPLFANPFVYHHNRVATVKPGEDKSLFNEIYRLNDDEQNDRRSTRQLSSYSANLEPSLHLFGRSEQPTNVSQVELNSMRLNQLDLILECSNKSSLLANEHNPSKNWVLRKSSGKVPSNVFSIDRRFLPYQRKSSDKLIKC